MINNYSVDKVDECIGISADEVDTGNDDVLNDLNISVDEVDYGMGDLVDKIDKRVDS